MINSGAVNVIITNPLWVVNTRIKMQGTKGCEEDKTSRFKGLIGMFFGVCRFFSHSFLMHIFFAAIFSFFYCSSFVPFVFISTLHYVCNHVRVGIC